MNSREPQPLIVGAGRLVVFGFKIGQQGELRQELFNVWKLPRKDRKLFEVLVPGTSVSVVLVQVILIARFEHQPDHFGGVHANSFSLQLRDRRHELRPGHGGLFWHASGAALQRARKWAVDRGLWTLDSGLWTLEFH